MTNMMDTTGFQDFLNGLAPSPPKDPHQEGRATAAKRKDAHKKMLEDFDLDALLAMQEKMAQTVDRITANQMDLKAGLLDEGTARELMVEILDQTDIKELLEVRRDMIRSVVFEHITEINSRQGAADPENTNGSLEVPELGKRFSKESCGRKPPKVDQEALMEELGDDFDKACRIEVIPEHVVPESQEYVLDHDKLQKMAEEDPAVLEKIRRCLIPGDYRTPRFHIRDMR